jgi:glutaredoxin
MPGGWRRLWRRRVPLGIRVVVYTRVRCPLCDEAARFLEGEQGQLGFTLEFVDIDADPRLQERHGHSVPVVEVDGLVRFRGKINPVLWRRLIAARRRDAR